MTKRLKRFLSLAPALVLSACVEPTLRDGIWELSYMGVKRVDRKRPDLNGKSFPLPSVLTRVQLGKDPDGEEMIQIDFFEEPGEPPEEEAPPEERPEAPVHHAHLPRPMFGDIRRAVEGNPPTVHIEDQDRFWNWRMLGVIRAPEEIDGTHFSALQRAEGGSGCEGRWRMRWLRPE
jgi:hypothetical protein